MTDDRIHIVLEEIEAVKAAIEMAERDDLVVLLVDKPAAAWRELEKRVSFRGEHDLTLAICCAADKFSSSLCRESACRRAGQRAPAP